MGLVPEHPLDKILFEVIAGSCMDSESKSTEKSTSEESEAKKIARDLIIKRTVLHIENERIIIGSLQKRILNIVEENEKLSDSQLTTLMQLTALMREHVIIKDNSIDLFTTP